MKKKPHMNRPASDPDPLAAWTDRALRQLPDRPAPTALAPRVLAEIRRRATAPWYRRPWLQWPGTPRWGSGLLLASSLVLLFGLLAPRAQELVQHQETFQQIARVDGTFSALGDALARVGAALLASAGQVESSAVIALLAVVAAAWMSTLGLGTACWRIARPHR